MIWYDMVRYWCQRLFVNSMKGKQTLRARGGLLEDVHKKSDGYNDAFQYITLDLDSTFGEDFEYEYDMCICIYIFLKTDIYIYLYIKLWY